MPGFAVLCRGRGHLLGHDPVTGFPACQRCGKVAAVTYTCAGCGERKRMDVLRLAGWMAKHRACTDVTPEPVPGPVIA
jgi:hypothetical protein